MAARKKMGPDWLRQVCVELAGTTEDLKWGADIVFSVADKMYCAMGVDGDGFGFKAELPVQEALIQREGIELTTNSFETPNADIRH